LGIVIYVNCFKGVKKNTAPKNNINIRKTKMILIIPACLSMFMSDFNYGMSPAKRDPAYGGKKLPKFLVVASVY